MARKKKIVENIKITGIADRGKAVGRDETGRVYFVDKAVPGDVVDVLVLRKKKSFFQGVVKKYRSLSEDRIDPKCAHFGTCGGCKWQHLEYSSQLKHKETTVKDAMVRLAKLPVAVVKEIIPCKNTFHYRNKLEYSFSNKRWLTEQEVRSDKEIKQSPALGFHAPGSFDKVVDIQECFLQDPFTNELRNFIRSFTQEQGWKYYDARKHHGLMRNMIFRNNVKGEWMVTLIFGESQKDHIQTLLLAIHDKYPSIVSLNYIINQKHNDSVADQEVINFSGDPHLLENLGDIQYKIGPKSFFQTNTHQAKILYDQVVKSAALTGHENVYDLYTGLGSIALYIAKNCKQVVGIEEVKPAIEDAKFNARLNQITNTTFYAGDVKNILTDTFAEKHGKPDLVITDPPRAGMHADVLEMLNKLAAPKIVYVSCNPSTQARDFITLMEKYNVESVVPVDMFPHTHHIESVAILSLKN